MNKRAFGALFTLIVVSLFLCYYTMPVFSASTTVMTFERSAYLAAAGTMFNVAVVVKDLSEQMHCWQLALSFDPSVIEYRNASLPSDNIFAGKDLLTGGPSLSNPGYVVLGAAMFKEAREPTGVYPSVNSSGKLCTFEFLAKNTGNTNLTLANQIEDTFLLHNDGKNCGKDILFTILNSSVHVDTFSGDVTEDKVIDTKDVAAGNATFDSTLDSPRLNSSADELADQTIQIQMNDADLLFPPADYTGWLLIIIGSFTMLIFRKQTLHQKREWHS